MEREYTMEQREATIRLWFDMWLKKADLGMAGIFPMMWSISRAGGRNITASQKSSSGSTSGTPAALFCGGKSSSFSIKRIKQSWSGILKSKMNNGNVEEFDGISLIVWTQDNKIKSLKEFGCNLHNYNPYRDSDIPVFREEKANWF